MRTYHSPDSIAERCGVRGVFCDQLSGLRGEQTQEPWEFGSDFFPRVAAVVLPSEPVGFTDDVSVCACGFAQGVKLSHANETARRSFHDAGSACLILPFPLLARQGWCGHHVTDSDRLQHRTGGF